MKDRSCSCLEECSSWLSSSPGWVSKMAQTLKMGIITNRTSTLACLTRLSIGLECVEHVLLRNINSSELSQHSGPGTKSEVRVRVLGQVQVQG